MTEFDEDGAGPCALKCGNREMPPLIIGCGSIVDLDRLRTASRRRLDGVAHDHGVLLAGVAVHPWGHKAAVRAVEIIAKQ
jgi:hypothetical protein